MKTQDKKLNDLINTRGCKLIIGGNQRNYEWRLQNCKKLLNDILEYKDQPNYWVGIIITKSTPQGNFVIHDGQQRTITAVLLYIALYHVLLKEKKFIKDFELTNYANFIYDTYICDKYSNDEDYPTKNRLVLRQKDDPIYDRIVNDKYVLDKTNILIQNYTYFYNFLKKQNKDFIQTLIKAMDKVNITQFYLESTDDECAIFESINATGRELTVGDIIKNRYYDEIKRSSLSKNLKDDMYSLLLKIEKNCDYDLSRMFKFYFYIKTNKWISLKDKINFLDNIKKEIINNFDDKELLIKDLYNFSELYCQILNCRYPNDKINECLKYTIRDNDNFYILIFDLIFNKNYLTDDELIQLIQKGESIFFRKWVCGHSYLHHTFKGIVNKVIRKENILENFVNEISSLSPNTFSSNGEEVIPSDKDFIKNLLTKNLYVKNVTKEWKWYIFNSFENYYTGVLTKEKINVYELFYKGDLSIEHIIPQTLTDEWKKELGENWKTISENNLHQLANLTITGYNSEYSNNSFKEKKDCQNGFKFSPYRMNQDIARYDCFNIDSLNDRNEKLKRIALKKWAI